MLAQLVKADAVLVSQNLHEALHGLGDLSWEDGVAVVHDVDLEWQEKQSHATLYKMRINDGIMRLQQGTHYNQHTNLANSPRSMVPPLSVSKIRNRYMSVSARV